MGDMDRWQLQNQAREAAEKAREAMMVQLSYYKHPAPKGAKTWTCPQCGDTFNLNGSSLLMRWESCQCGQQEYERVRQAFEQEHRSEAVTTHWERARIPRRFQSHSFETFVKRPGAAEALVACKSYANEFQQGKTTTGLLLSGGYGAGKTHLAIAVGRALTEKHFVQVRFAQVGDMLQQLKASDFDWEPIEEATKAEFLILDDLAQDSLSVHDRGVLFNLVNARYEAMRPTIFTTNCGERELIQILGGALYSRLCEMSEAVLVTAGDYRRGGR